MYGSTTCDVGVPSSSFRYSISTSAPAADRVGQRRDQPFLGVLRGRLRASCESSNSPKVSSSFLRTRSSGRCASAAISGPTNSSASRIARASSGVSRGAERNVSPKSSLSTCDVVAVQLGVDGVAAAAEVDEVEEREVLLELLVRNLEALDEVGGRDDGLALVAAGGEQVGEERLEEAEALRRHRPGGPLRDGIHRLGGDLAGRAWRAAPSWRARTRRRLSATSRRRSGGETGTARPSWRSTHEASIGRLAYSVTKTPVLEPAARGPNARSTHQAVSGRTSMRASPTGVAELPGGTAAERVDVELGREPEVALAAGGEADVAADAGDAERAQRVAVEVVADDVPDAAVVEQPVRVERALGLLAARHRPVGELDRALLGDRGLQLRQPAGHLRRVVGVAHLDPNRRSATAPRRTRPGGRARGSGARAGAARRRRTSPRAGRSRSGARPARRR